MTAPATPIRSVKPDRMVLCTVRIPESRTEELRAFADTLCPPKPKPTGDTPQRERRPLKDTER
jgi:hypothetical protein